MPESKKELVTFPNWKIVENSIFIINSDTISLNKELDRVASVIRASTGDARKVLKSENKNIRLRENEIPGLKNTTESETEKISNSWQWNINSHYFK